MPKKRPRTHIDERRWVFADYYPFIQIHYYLQVSSPGCGGYNNPRWTTREALMKFMDVLKPWDDSDPYFNKWIKPAWSGGCLGDPIYPVPERWANRPEAKQYTIWQREARVGGGMDETNEVHYWTQFHPSWDGKVQGSIEHWANIVLGPTLDRIDLQLKDAGIYFSRRLWLNRELECLNLNGIHGSSKGNFPWK